MAQTVIVEVVLHQVITLAVVMVLLQLIQEMNHLLVVMVRVAPALISGIQPLVIKSFLTLLSYTFLVFSF